jgi:hypothetical protein
VKAKPEFLDSLKKRLGNSGCGGAVNIQAVNHRHQGTSAMQERLRKVFVRFCFLLCSRANCLASREQELIQIGVTLKMRT